MDWNENISILWRPKAGDPPTIEDFTPTTESGSAMPHRYAVEGLWDVFSEIIYGRSDEPWVLVASSMTILSPQDVRGLFSKLREHVSERGRFGVGIG